MVLISLDKKILATFFNDCLIHLYKHSPFASWGRMCRFQTCGLLGVNRTLHSVFIIHFVLKCGLYKWKHEWPLPLTQDDFKEHPSSPLTLGSYQSSSILLTPSNWLDVRTIHITPAKTAFYLDPILLKDRERIQD